MDYVGLACLGLFVGGLGTIGVQFVTSVGTWTQVLSAIIAASLSGTVVMFLDRFRSARALGAYCIGLFLAYMWAYIPIAVTNFKSPDPNTHLLGLAQFLGTALVSIVAAALLLPPAFREAWTARP